MKSKRYKMLPKNTKNLKPNNIIKLLDLVKEESVYLEEYARSMIGQEELHALEVEKMLKG